MVRSNIEESYTKIEKNISLIKNCINYYYNAKISNAYKCIKQILNNYLDSPIIVSSLNESYAFRGIAVLKSRYHFDNPCYDVIMNRELSFFRARC